jgi:hypothetical protein
MDKPQLLEELDVNEMYLCEGFLALYCRGYYDNVDAKQKEGIESWCKELHRIYITHRQKIEAVNKDDPDTRRSIWVLVLKEIDEVFGAKEGLMGYVLYTLLAEKQDELVLISTGKGNPIKYNFHQ